MKLKKLKAEGIFSLGKVDLDLQDRGLILITGYSEDEGSSNGAGKSSVSTKAISWALFGQIPGDIKAEEVVNIHTAGTGKAELEFIDNNGNDCKIIRKRNKKTSTLKLLVSGADVSSRNMKETQQNINNLIGRDFNAFIETDYFGQSKELGYASFTSKQQKEILEQILPMEVCDKWADFAKSEYKRIDDLESKKTAEVNSVQITYKTIEQQLKLIQTSSDTWEKEKLSNVKELEKEKSEKLKLSNKVITEIENIKKRIDDIAIIPEGDFQKILNVKKDCINQIKIYKAALIEWEKAYAQFNLMVNEKNAKYTNISHMHTNYKCPICEGPLKQKTLDKIKEIEAVNKELKTEMIELDRNIKYAIDRLQYFDLEIGKQETTISECDKDITIFNRVKEHKTELMITYSVLKNDPVIKDIEKIDVLIDEKKKQVNPYIKSINNMKTEIKKLSADLKRKKSEQELLNLLSKDHLYWFNIYSKDLKLKIFEAVCSFLDSRTAYYLNALSNDQIHVEFSTIKTLASGEKKEDFSVRAWSDTGGGSYGALSGGEKKVVSFAIGLALADLASSQTTGTTDFMILDEPFEQLDERNSEAMINYLNDICSKSTVLLVSNEEHLKQLVPQRINVVKRKGISNVE